MKQKQRLIVVGVFVALILMALVIFLLRRNPRLYRVTVLPSLDGTYTCPDAINDRGYVVGQSAVAGGGLHLFLWDRDHGIQDLGPVDGPADINNEGQIAATMVDPNGERRAFILTPGGTRRLLGTLGGSTSIAMALNNRGQVVGESWTAAGINHAFLWDEAQGMRDLSPPNTQQNHAYAINDRGQVMVFSPRLGVSLWDPNTGFPARSSPMLGAAFGGIDNKGRAVFVRRLPTGKSRLVISDARSGWETLREFEENIGEVKLNDLGQVLYTESRPSRLRWLNRLFARRLTQSYVLDPNRGVVLLNRFVPHGPDEYFLMQDTNGRGDVVGVLLSTSTNRRRGVLLEPVPERWKK